MTGLEILFVAIAITLTAGQFIVTKIYKSKIKDSLFSDFFYSFMGSFIAVLLLLGICRFQIQFNWFSFLMAVGMAVAVRIYVLFGLKAAVIGRTAIFTMSVMLGGTLWPFAYGAIFLGEVLNFQKILATIILIVALVLPLITKNDKKIKKPMLFIILCVVAFFANGAVSIISKMHQVSDIALDTYQFSFWTNVAATVMSFICLIPIWNKSRKNVELNISMKNSFSIKSFVIISLSALSTVFGSIFLLNSAITVDATVLYPIVTGGVIVITTLVDSWASREKIPLKLKISLLMNVVAVILMII